MTAAPAIAWRWPLALLGLVCSIPAAVVTLHDPSEGLALAFGALPAAAVGIGGPRRSRIAVLVVGLCIGLGLLIGSTLEVWPIAVPVLFGLCLGTAVLSSVRREGLLLMSLAVPMVGAGLSFGGDVGAAFDLAALLAAGGAIGWLVCLCWPDQPAPAASPRPLAPRPVMVEYGVRLGLAGALCAGLGFALDLDHKGWATAACLLVMRPTAEMTRLRGAGRATSVSTGALAACVIAVLDPPNAVMALTVVVALTGLAATRPSRWYVTGGFTTFIVLSLMVYGAPEQAGDRFAERVLETIIGVGAALLFGVAIPAIRDRRLRLEA